MPKAKATELPGLKSRWKPQITNDDVYVVTGITGNFDGEVWITAEREADRISIIRRVDQFYESMAPEPTTKAGDNVAIGNQFGKAIPAGEANLPDNATLLHDFFRDRPDAQRGHTMHCANAMIEWLHAKRYFDCLPAEGKLHEQRRLIILAVQEWHRRYCHGTPVGNPTAYNHLMDSILSPEKAMGDDWQDSHQRYSVHKLFDPKRESKLRDALDWLVAAIEAGTKESTIKQSAALANAKRILSVGS